MKTLVFLMSHVSAPGDAVDDGQCDDSSPTVIQRIGVGEQNDENTSVSDEPLAAPGATVDDVQVGDQGVTIIQRIIVTPEDTENTGVSDESCGCDWCCC